VTVEGIDISAHQMYTPSLAGRDFVICRATWGNSPDSAYQHHASAVRKAGRVLGAYAYGLAAEYASVASQVAAFFRRANDVPPDLFALDVEKPRHMTQMSKGEAREFVYRVHQAGHRIGLYRSDSAFYDVGQDWNWVANWSTTPSHRWDIHQYRGDPLDLDRYHGTRAELRAFAGILPDTSTGDPMLSSTAPKMVSYAAGEQLYDLDGKPLTKSSQDVRRKDSPWERELDGKHYRVIAIQSAGEVKPAMVHNSPSITIESVPDYRAAYERLETIIHDAAAAASAVKP
jgi:Glycosyl hydrolases family 25